MKEIDINLHVLEIVLLVDIYNKNDNINLTNDCIKIYLYRVTMMIGCTFSFNLVVADMNIFLNRNLIVQTFLKEILKSINTDIHITKAWR